MKLISMTDFVLEHPATTDYEWQLSKHLKYANFLKQPLTLGMFVPTDEDGNVLEDLKYCCDGHHCGCKGMPINVCSHKEIEVYVQAKERVFFEGFELSLEDECIYQKDENFIDLVALTAFTIDEISTWDEEIILTKSAIKQIGL